MAFKAPVIDFSKIKNIIFDLGDVIIDIDFDLTFNAFAQLGGVMLEESKAIFEKTKIWEIYEEGGQSEADFLNALRDAFNIHSATDDQLIKAWNTILGELPETRVERIKELSKDYRLFLLSNTSHLHVVEVNNILKQSTGVDDLKLLFEKAYYSFELGCRKPGNEIYEKVLSDAGIEATETVFLDDNAQNIEGANLCGIQGVLVEPNGDMLDYLSDA